jgi:hypothetical protein
MTEQQLLRQTLLQAQIDKSRRTPRINYTDQNSRKTNEKKDKK